MRVIVPCSQHGLHDGVLNAITSSGFVAEYRNVSRSDSAYWKMLADLWVAGDDFAVVEQDIVVQPGTLQTFRDCPNVWCAAKYRYLAGMYAGLGCVRFRAEIMRQAPDLMERVGEMDLADHGLKHWCTLDAAIQLELEGRPEQFRVCVRHGDVDHVGGNEPAHGCVPGYANYREKV